MPFAPDNLRRLGNQISVSIPKDDDGFLGRECPEPECELYFKIKPGTGLTGGDLPCHCPYCGYTGPTDRFWTKEQIEYAKSVALRQFSDAFVRDLNTLEFEHKPQRGGIGIGISLKVKPGARPAVRCYREKTLETHVTCKECGLEYAVYGVFVNCPDCGVHNSVQMLQRNLDIVRRLLPLAEQQTDSDLKRSIIEDALENCVSSFDGVARELIRAFGAKSADSSGTANMSFQNLQRAAARLQSVFGIDLQQGTAIEDWNFAHRCFMQRHLLAHTAGVIDRQYLDQTGESVQLLGRRVMVGAADVERLVVTVEMLGTGLAASLEALPVRQSSDKSSMGSTGQ